ncbi:MAG: dihydroxyacetone kinase subunit L [Rikenellaceae bacterium]
MNTLTLADLKKMFTGALSVIVEKENEFSQLDAVIGDGDHGTAMTAAFTAAVEALNVDSDFKQTLGDMGMNVMLKTSGSTSTLLGGFILGMSDNSEGSELSVEQVKKMFKGGLEGVAKNTNAKPGDKTMMDALYPGIEAMQECTSDSIKEVIAAGAAAAKAGAEGTVAMKANFGRARNYGEKSIGFMDSGAASWSTMLQAFSDAL